MAGFKGHGVARDFHIIELAHFLYSGCNHGFDYISDVRCDASFDCVKRILRSVGEFCVT